KEYAPSLVLPHVNLFMGAGISQNGVIDTDDDMAKRYRAESKEARQARAAAIDAPAGYFNGAVHEASGRAESQGNERTHYPDESRGRCPRVADDRASAG